MKHIFHEKFTVAILGAIMIALPNIIFAGEDGLGTNVMKNIRIQPTGVGVIDLGGTAITNWNQVGSTVDVANLQGATGSLNTAVGNLNTATNLLNTATGTLNTAVGDLNTATDLLNTATGTLNTAVGNLNTATNLLNTATNSLNTRAVKWDNAVVNKTGAAGDDGMAYSNVYYFGVNNSWSNASAANSATAKGLLGLALGGDPATDGFLLNGQCTGAWNFVAGAILYLATNNNQITADRPTGTNHIVRIVGYAIDNTNIYFNPDRTYIEIVGGE